MLLLHLCIFTMQTVLIYDCRGELRHEPSPVCFQESLLELGIN